MSLNASKRLPKDFLKYTMVLVTEEFLYLCVFRREANHRRFIANFERLRQDNKLPRELYVNNVTYKL